MAEFSLVNCQRALGTVEMGGKKRNPCSESFLFLFCSVRNTIFLFLQCFVLPVYRATFSSGDGTAELVLHAPPVP